MYRTNVQKMYRTLSWKQRDLVLLPSIVAVLGFFIFSSTNAEEECLTGKSYWCYECDSWSDARCKDPFNWTALPSDLPTLKQCEGCCVKIVMNYSKPNEVVRRTCTKNIVINLFMVDHVCMYEGHKTGHMCFCEGDHCNTASTINQRIIVLLLMTSFLFLGIAV